MYFFQFNSLERNITVPASEPATIFVSTSKDIRRMYLNGTSYPGPKCNVQALSLTFDHRNRTICFIHQYNKTGVAKLSCAKVDDLSVFWDLPSPKFYPLLGLNINCFFKKNILLIMIVFIILSYYSCGIRLGIRKLVLCR